MGNDLQQLRGRVEAVAAGKFENLREENGLSLGKFRLTADIHIHCEDCGTQYRAAELLDQGGCKCE